MGTGAKREPALKPLRLRRSTLWAMSGSQYYFAQQGMGLPPGFKLPF